jgi:hypothetical protein
MALPVLSCSANSQRAMAFCLFAGWEKPVVWRLA